MSKKRSSLLDAKRASALLRWYVGEHTGKTLTFAIALLVSSGLFVNGAFQGILEIMPFWATLAPFPALAGYIIFRAKQDMQQLHIEVEENTHPAKVRALILFLSPPSSGEGRNDTELIHSLLASNGRNNAESFLSEATRNRFQGPWRMPLESISHHYPAISHISIIPSSDHIDQRSGNVRPGTHEFESKFISLVEELTPNDGHPIIFHPLNRLGDEWQHGANFESVKELVKCLDAAYRHLEEQGISGRDILVDITGGQKPPTIAGAMMALAEGRRFQYVSTQDKAITQYDVTYAS